MEFENLINNEEIKHNIPKKGNTKGKASIILGNVTVLFNDDAEEDFDNITSLNDLLILDRKKTGYYLCNETRFIFCFSKYSK